ncbi:MAG: hypothetical protein P1U57_00915 [Oleibacter sp.]|nr:hypothetical protein [Thalassolituus sp.]
MNVSTLGMRTFGMGMRTSMSNAGLIIALFLSSLSGQVVAADEALTANQVVPVIDGEVFDRIFIIKGEDSNSSQAIKYIRKSEEINTWTKQVIYTRINDKKITTPALYANAVIEGLQQINVGAKYQLSGSENGEVMMLDFIAQPPGQNFLEFNVYRIEIGSKGVYSLQMIARLPLIKNPTQESMAPIIELRKAWLVQAASYDMSKVMKLLDVQ